MTVRKSVKPRRSHSELIVENPITRKKGFKTENLRITPSTADDTEVACRLDARITAGDISFLTNADKALLERIQGSYQRKIAGESPQLEDFTLSGHELGEFQKIQSADTFRYLIYRYKYNKYPELKVVGDYPPCVQIEPTSVCNFRCVMCYQADDTFSHKSAGFMGHMDLNLFKKVVDEIAGNVEAVTFASRGEPMLNANILDMLEYCRGKFIGLKLNTNASILNEKLIHGLLSSDLQTLVFSIDAAGKTLYEKIRVNGNFEKLMANLERFAHIRETQYRNSPIMVRISGVKLNNEQEIGQMQEYWQRFADIVAFTNYNPWQDSYNNPFNEVEEPCSELWRRVFVWWDGKVNPCDFDYKSTLSKWSLSNPDTTVSNVWTSPYYNELRERHLARQRSTLAPCNRCVAI